MKIQGKYIVAGIILLFSIGLALDSASNYMNPYLSVTVVNNNWNSYVEKNIQVMGRVKEGSVFRGDGGMTGFMISDGTEMVDVQYSKPLPQNFDEGKDVVVVGSPSSDGTLIASNILVKCPSKYESDTPPQENTHIFYTAIALAVLAGTYLATTIVWKRS